MCNCNCTALTLTSEAKEASESTKNINGDIRKKRTPELIASLEAQNGYAQKGLLAKSTLKIEKVFDSSCYGFLTGCTYDTIHPNLQDHALINGNMGLFRVNRTESAAADAKKIADGGRAEAKSGDVFQIRGYDLANMTVVLGDSGWIVMDVLTSSDTANEAMQLLREKLYVTGKDIATLPVKAIIYSHSHVDHYAGVGGLVTEKECKDGIVQVFAPQGFLENAVSENVYAGNAMSTRAAFMYGTNLLKNEKGQVDAGLGKATSVGSKTLFAPTKEITFGEYKKDCKYQEIVIDQLTIQFQLTPGTEAPSEMNVYLEGSKVLFIAENCCGTLHNLYTLRGAEVRDALTWASYLDETIATFGDVQTICSSHNWPQFSKSVSDNSDCIDYLKKQRDVYRYLGNTALNLINKGYTIEEIGRKMEEIMPQPIMDEWRSHGFYGSINHNAKAVYQRYIGWYDSNPSNLNKLVPIEAATEYVKAMGGAHTVFARAVVAFEEGKYAWAAELLNRLIFAKLRECDESIKKQAKLLNADVLEQLGYQSESAPWRNEYLTAAMVLRAEADGKTPVRELFGLEDSIVNAMSPEMLMQFMSIMFEGYLASTKNLSLDGYVTFTDGEIDPSDKTKYLPVSISYEVSGGVLTCLPYNGSDGTKDLGFSGTKKQFYDIIMGINQTLIGTNFDKLRIYIKPFSMGFSIVSPATAGDDDRTAVKVSLTITQEQRLQIFQAAQMIEQYEEQFVAYGFDYYLSTIQLKDNDLTTWKELRPKIVKLSSTPKNPVDDTLFFNPNDKPYNDTWGIGCDGLFNKAEYAHFLYECYRSLYIDAPKTPGLLADCIKMLQPLVDSLRGKEPTKNFGATLETDKKNRWLEDFYPILVGHNIIADSMFTYPIDNKHREYGIGTDGKYDFTELCNVLMRCYKAAMVDELYRLRKEYESGKK